MKKTFTGEAFRDSYVLDDKRRWMEIMDDEKRDDIGFKQYKAHKERLERLLGLFDLDEGFEVAEYGCGNGLLAALIQDKVKNYVGVDFSECFVELAEKRKVANAKFYCEDIVEFAKNNQGRFDRVFSMDFSEHVYDDGFLKIFEAVMSTLKPGGKLYIHTPNGDYFLELLKGWGILSQIDGHIGVRNKKKHLKLLDGIGVEKVKVSYLSHYVPLLKAFHFLKALPVFGKFFGARLFIECEK